MLILTRRIGESIQIGDDITITVTRVKGGHVSIGTEAPKHIHIVRPELLRKSPPTKRKASE